MTRKELNVVLPLILAAVLAGMVLIAYATRFGPGVGGDATIYLTSAQNLLAGKGLGWTEANGSFRLLPYFPPFYPLVLSGVGLFVKDLVAGARWLNILLFGLTIALIGWFFYRFTGRPWLAAILSGILATSPVIIGVQVWAMSEPLFLFLGFAGLLVLLEHLQCPRWTALVGSAVLCGLSFLARYIGIAFVITGGLALLLFRRGDDRQTRLSLRWPELREGLMFGLVAILPTLVWLVVDFSLTGTVGSRSGQPASAYWQRFLEIGPAMQKIYLFWLLPDSVIARLPGVLQVALWLIPLLLLIAAVVLLARRLNRAPLDGDRQGSQVRAVVIRLAALFGLFILVFMVVLAVVQVFTFPPITLASRMLSPVHVAVLVFLFALLHLALALYAPRSNIRVIVAVAYLACLALLGTYALRGVLIARDYHRAGIGYTSPAWQNSRTVEMLRQLPPTTPIISNETTAVMFLANRTAYPLLEIYQSHPQESFTPYGAGEDLSQRVFREQRGALVLFKESLHDDFSMYGSRVDERLRALTSGLTVYYDGEDGAIFFYQPVR